MSAGIELNWMIKSSGLGSRYLFTKICWKNTMLFFNKIGNSNPAPANKGYLITT